MNSEIFFESCGDERVTPQDFFDKVHAEFNFDIDAAASSLNAKLPTYFGEGGVAYDALQEDWGGLRCWLNPPYSVSGAFVAKAKEEADKGALVVMLLPARTDTKYWHHYIWDKDAYPEHQLVKVLDTLPNVSYPDGNWRPGVRGRFIPGRLSFELKVPDKMRALIIAEMKKVDQDLSEMKIVAELVEATGLPKMAIKRICQGMPDEDLLDSAPFPSALIIFGDQK